MLSCLGTVGSVAFSAGVSAPQSQVFENGVIVPYNRVFTNEGLGYSNNTGVFTAPKVVSLFNYFSSDFEFYCANYG
jgi:hypothetical protein